MPMSFLLCMVIIGHCFFSFSKKLRWPTTWGRREGLLLSLTCLKAVATKDFRGVMWKCEGYFCVRSFFWANDVFTHSVWRERSKRSPRTPRTFHWNHDDVSMECRWRLSHFSMDCRRKMTGWSAICCTLRIIIRCANHEIFPVRSSLQRSS